MIYDDYRYRDDWAFYPIAPTQRTALRVLVFI